MCCIQSLGPELQIQWSSAGSTWARLGSVPKSLLALTCEQLLYADVVPSWWDSLQELVLLAVKRPDRCAGVSG